MCGAMLNEMMTQATATQRRKTNPIIIYFLCFFISAGGVGDLIWSKYWRFVPLVQLMATLLLLLSFAEVMLPPGTRLLLLEARARLSLITWWGLLLPSTSSTIMGKVSDFLGVVTKLLLEPPLLELLLDESCLDGILRTPLICRLKSTSPWLLLTLVGSKFEELGEGGGKQSLLFDVPGLLPAIKLRITEEVPDALLEYGSTVHRLVGDKFGGVPLEP
jgi:hypothetical protein